MSRTPRYLLVLLFTVGAWRVMRTRKPRASGAPPPRQTGYEDLLSSAVGEEDPGAAVDSPAPPPRGGGRA